MLEKVSQGETPYGDTNLSELNPYKSARESFEKFATTVDKLVPSMKRLHFSCVYNFVARFDEICISKQVSSFCILIFPFIN